MTDCAPPPCSAASKWGAAEEPAKGLRRWVTSRGFGFDLRRSQTAPKVAVLRANSAVNLEAHKMSQSAAASCSR